MKSLQEMKCVKHNLLFAVDRDRVRELGVEPALMGCPLCARQLQDRLIAELGELREHRDTLLKAIDLKVLLVPASVT